MRVLARLLSLTCVVLLGLPPALAQTPAASRPDLRPRLQEVMRDTTQVQRYTHSGQKVAAFCANCHGMGGNSTSPDIPNLAGQNPLFLLDQIQQFADGRRKFEFMERLIRAMTADEILGISLYYAGQTVKPQPITDSQLVAQGKTYYDKICWRCHGDKGLGSETFARIAGQQPKYLTETLHRYRDGSARRADPVMAENTRQMKDADIKAVVAYLSSLQ